MHKQNILQVRAFLVSSCQRTLLVNVSPVSKDCVMEKEKKMSFVSLLMFINNIYY